MLVRLAFSVMIQVDADVLLIDEVLAVGDASFQQKCFDEFERIRRSGTTVLLVTHDMSSVRRFCDRAMLLENGRMVEIGDPEHVGERYLELNFSQDARKEAQVEIETQRAGGEDAAEPGEAERTVGGTDRTEGEEPTRYGDRRAEIVDAWFEREDGTRTTVLPTGRPFRFAARARFNEDVDDPLFGVIFHDPRGIYVMSASSLWTHPQLGVRRAGDEVTFRISYDNVLAPGRFLISPAVACHGHWLDRRDRMLSVMVTGTRETEGVADPPYEVDIQTDPVARAAVEA
jgi:ABC-2 type transport system ATP-binding protein